MLTIKQFSIDNQRDVFNQILLDTEPIGYLPSLVRLFSEEIAIKKAWIGKTDQQRNTFVIMRTKVGFFKTAISMTKICGQLTQDKTKIEVKLKPLTLVIVNVILGTAFLGFMVSNFFNDWIGWTVLVGLVLIQLLIFILDFRTTDQRFAAYIYSLRGNARVCKVNCVS